MEEFMDFRGINTFIHVANQESFSKAADILGYTQAAVSIQIKQLESELGDQAFRPHRQTHLPYAPGKDILPVCPTYIE
ncbi:MAG: LysR family transcriptional regulator [Dorea sp.]